MHYFAKKFTLLITPVFFINVTAKNLLIALKKKKKQSMQIFKFVNECFKIFA